MNEIERNGHTSDLVLTALFAALFFVKVTHLCDVSWWIVSIPALIWASLLVVGCVLAFLVGVCR